jgi:hypothetical protein
LIALRDDVINNWDTNYSNTAFPPGRQFDGGAIHITSNWQIYKKNFFQVPLIKNLVDTFESFLFFPLTWYGCYANKKKVMSFRSGTKTLHWVNKSPRPLLFISEVKRKKMKRPQGHSTTMYLLRQMIGMQLRITLKVKSTWSMNFPKMKVNQLPFHTIQLFHKRR